MNASKLNFKKEIMDMEFGIMVILGKCWERQKFEIRRDMTSC